MAKYLYGANVKSVQSFIFQTSKLKEIIGASELVEQICTSLFKNQVKKACSCTFNDSKSIVSAAGIIKYVFDDETTCKGLVRVFPKVVAETAPGVIFNQAVVKITGEQLSHEELKLLEQRLKTQRNKSVPFFETGLRITERSRRTGLPGIKYDEDEVIDKSTSLKKNARVVGTGTLSANLLEQGEELKGFKFPENLAEIADKGNNIAIIHADGNNLGKAIRYLNENLDKASTDTSDSISRNKAFSQAIDDATKAAAKKAILKTFDDIIEAKQKVIPMRPVIFGGDDFTVICNAEYALKLTTVYLQEFENETEKAFKSKGVNMPPLTACAGIAYIKAKYPFHYGARLAEELCAYSKKEAKKTNPEQVPACLTFHHVQSSFIGDYSGIRQRELYAKPTNILLSGSPYYINPDEGTLTNLIKQVKCLNNSNTPTSKLREWISTCHLDSNAAKNDLERIIKVLEGQNGQQIIKTLLLDELLEKIKQRGEDIIQTTLYDAITLDSLNTKI